MHARRKTLLAAGVALGLASGTLLSANAANAATYLSINLSASGAGASAVLDASGDPVLTVGSPSSTTYAEMQVDNVPTTAPSSAPSFATSNYSAGSPAWEIQFADGDSLYGYPSQAGLGDTNWAVIPASSGACADLTHTPEYDTYTNVLAFIQDNGCAGNVTAAAIVANGDQAAGTSDTITDVSYNGETLAPTSGDAVTVGSPGDQTSTTGVAIGTLQLSASSSEGDTITSYTATGLPPGLSISSTGAITGTPSTTGSYSVTVTATDEAGTEGSTSFEWTVSTTTTSGDVVTVDSPGNQTSTTGVSIATLQLSASSSEDYSITSYTATGLPTGLSISSTGAITGTPSTTGSYSVTVTATDEAGTEGSVSFTWTVSTTTTGTTSYSGTIRLVKLGLCLDDRYNSSTPGAVVQVWRCNGSANQQWQVMSNGTIQHNGLCLDARGAGTTSGTKVDLWTCTGNNNQLWDTSSWHIHYDNPSASDQVLDDTGWGRSGTQQDIWVNNGGANQIWQTS
jgi:Ricin-type beta-trefoil lectin domain/Putative Ig domain